MLFVACAASGTAMTAATATDATSCLIGFMGNGFLVRWVTRNTREVGPACRSPRCAVTIRCRAAIENGVRSVANRPVDYTYSARRRLHQFPENFDFWSLVRAT